MTTTQPEILIRIDGEPLPLSDLTWETLAPCGCTCGVAIASYIGADREAAARHLVPNAEQRRRDEAAGFVLRLVNTEEAIARFKAPQECPHTPRLGVEKVPVPDGYGWGDAHGQRRSHLVQVPPVPEGAESKRYRQWRTDWDVTTLCGRDRDGRYERTFGDLPTCRTCERKAKAMTTAVSS